MEKTIRIIVAGPRDFADETFVSSQISDILSLYDDYEIEIVQGGAKGVDSIAKRYAIKNNLSCREFKADWNTYRRSAGPKRNDEMAKYGDVLIAFYKGTPGTSDMIRKAMQYGLKIHIIPIDENQN